MNRPLLWILGFLMALIAIFNLTYDNTDNPLCDFQGEAKTVTGIVDSTPKEKTNTTSFSLTLLQIDDATFSTRPFATKKVQVTLSHYNSDCPIDLKAGDIITLTGELTLPDAARNPGGFNYALYLRGKGIEGLLYTKDLKGIRILGEDLGITYGIGKIRTALCNTCDSAFTSDQSDVIKGILLGDKDIDTDIQEQFSDAGISHLLAVSGLHVAYLYAVILFITGLLKLNEKKRFCILIPCLLFYIVLTGGAASVIRAAIMLGFAGMGDVVKRHYDSLNGLCLAAIIILILSPAQLFAAGFQMSFCAVLAIIFLYKPFCFQYSRLTKQEPGKLVQSLLITLSATIGTLPAVLYHYHSFTLTSLISNIIMVPLGGALLIAGLITVPVMCLIPSSVTLFKIIPGALAQLVLDLSNLFSKIPGLQFSGAAPGIIGIALLIFIVLGIAGYYNLRHRKNRIIAGIIGILLVAGLVITSNLPKDFTITYLDVGQGDSALIETPAGGVYLIDGGGYENVYGSDRSNADRTPISEKVLLPALYSKGITHIDGVFITHNHADHVQGIEELLTVMPVDHIYVTTKYNDTALLNQTKIPVTRLCQDMILSTEDGMILQVLWPDDKIESIADDDQNEASLVMRIVYGNRSFLFTGDAGIETESKIDALHSDVIKIGHHGSNSATSDAFIQKVSPALAVISVGEYNTYGHPTDEVLTTLNNHGVTVYRTDQQGAIVISTDGNDLKIKTYLNQ